MRKRQARRLKVDANVATALLRIIAFRGGDRSPTLDVAKVVAVEEALACAFTDDVLACFAAGAFVLDDIVPLTHTAREQGLRDAWVALWRFRRKSYVLVPRHPDDDDASVFVLGLNDDDPGVPARERLVFWLEQIALREGAPPDTKLVLARKGSVAPTFEGVPFVPALVARSSKKKTPPLVRHPKFGSGEVVREEAGKVVVRFGDGVERTLLSSAVTRSR